MGTLYVVATPIGNLEDITARAVRILREVSLVAAEDTRKTRRLLSGHNIVTRITSYHEANKKTKLGLLLTCLGEMDVAIVSNAGMPGVNDPGYELIASAISSGIAVVPVPGPSAIIAALVVSGLPTHQFTFLGFLPRTAGERRRLLASVAEDRRTLIVFEAPHRLQESLDDILTEMGDRQIAVCREMTKLHEEVFRGSVREALLHFQKPRGEITLVIAGKQSGAQGEEVGAAALREVESLREQGMGLKDAVSLAAAGSGISKKTLYDRCKTN
jgi:16S rRNA (cytidine1402-2'-O)-methyltransferase